MTAMNAARLSPRKIGFGGIAFLLPMTLVSLKRQPSRGSATRRQIRNLIFMMKPKLIQHCLQAAGL
jgi:hypothetical protein